MLTYYYFALKFHMMSKDNSVPPPIDNRVLKIANKIKELRVSKGYTSHETFAWDNNLNRVQYWRVENGANITIKTLLTVLDIHKITLADFFRDIS